MTEGNLSIPELALQLKRLGGTDVMRVAALVRIVSEDYADQFEALLKAAGIGRRRAYLLAQVDRAFEGSKVPTSRLNAIGLTKLVLVVRYATPETMHELLNLAEETTVHELEAILAGETIEGNVCAMMLRLPKAQDLRFRKLLQRYGAEGNVGGLARKEPAMIRLMDDLEARLASAPNDDET